MLSMKRHYPHRKDELAEQDGDYRFRLGQTEGQNGDGTTKPATTDPGGGAE